MALHLPPLRPSPEHAILKAATSTAFRPDIEGLRAVAILPVVLLHGGVDRLVGGFLGVDIFFVISGYLITRILAREWAAGHFTYAGFYRRRAARILPAMIVMVAACLALGAVFLLPFDAAALGWSALSASAFAANVHFFASTNYFNAFNTQLLLHLWSLGVEEQFYLLYPLLFVAISRRWPRHRTGWIGALLVVSLIAAAILVRFDAQAAFYLLPGRGWQLGLGAFVALGGIPPISRRWLREGLLALALLAIVASLLLITRASPLPVPGALGVCLGTAALLAWGQSSLAGAALSLPPLRWIGRISFSVYLWHWPIMTAWRIETGFDLSRAESLGLTLISILVGALSYALIERPLLRHRPTLRQAVLALALLATASLALALGARHIPRDPEVARIAAYLDYRGPDRLYQFRSGSCFLPDRLDFDRCLTYAADRPNILVVGNSYAAQVWRTLAERMPHANVIQATMPGCHPLIDTDGDATCRAAMARIFTRELASGRVDGLILAANWTAASPPQVARTVAALRARGLPVTVIGPPAEYQGSLPRLLATGADRGQPRYADRFLKRSIADTDAAMQRAVEGSGGAYYSLWQHECPAGHCQLLTPNGVPMHFDPGHLTLDGARLLLGDFERQQR